MIKPHGIITALVTPMNEKEEINEKELRNHVNRMIGAGVHGLFCLGTNGEFYALSFEEKLEVIKIVLDENRGRLPVYAGTGCISTEDTIVLSKKARVLGVDGLSIVSPYYVAVSQEELYNHYKEVAEAAQLPVILYNIPARTGNSIDYTTVARLSKIKNIIGVKDSSGNFDNTLRYLEETNKDFAVLSGNDSLVLWTLIAGGTGTVSGIANIFPEIMVEIYENWKNGNFEAAKKAQAAIRPMRECFKLGNPNTIVKRTLNLIGHPVGPARRPASGLSGNLDNEIMKVLKTHYKDYLKEEII